MKNNVIIYEKQTVDEKGITSSALQIRVENNNGVVEDGIVSVETRYDATYTIDGKSVALLLASIGNAPLRMVKRFYPKGEYRTETYCFLMAENHSKAVFMEKLSDIQERQLKINEELYAECKRLDEEQANIDVQRCSLAKEQADLNRGRILLFISFVIVIIGSLMQIFLF